MSQNAAKDGSVSGVKSDIGPFAIIPEWVLRLGLSNGALRVYVELALMADRDTGEAFPRRRVLADRCEASVRTVATWLSEAKAAGVIDITDQNRDDGSRRASLYHVRFSSPGPAADVTHPREESRTAITKVISEPESKNQKLPMRNADALSRFDEFWAVFPLRRGKAPAEKAWSKAVRSTDPETIISGAARYRDELASLPDPPKTKWPQGWLTDRRWEDEPLPASNGHHEETIEERHERLGIA